MSMICDVTLMYSLKLFFYFNGWETDWVDSLTIIYPVKPVEAHVLLFTVIVLDSHRCLFCQPPRFIALVFRRRNLWFKC